MLTSPIVSVIMPCFNSAPWVEEAIRSIQAQSFEDWELLVVDDGSSDDSYQRISMLSSGDTRIIAAQLGQRRGAVAARNHGLSMARGRYLAFCDSDDLWLPKKLELQLNEMLSHGAVISCTAYQKIRADGAPFGRLIQPPKHIDRLTLLRSNCIGMSTAMIDGAACGKFLLPDISRRQDYALWLSLAAKGFTAIGVSEALVQYRVRSNSLSRNKLLASYYHWRVLRDIAGLSGGWAMFYFGTYMVAGIRKAWL